MQLRAYLIRNQMPHVINSQMHQVVAILSGKKNKVMGTELHVARRSA